MVSPPRSTRLVRYSLLLLMLSACSGDGGTQDVPDPSPTPIAVATEAVASETTQEVLAVSPSEAEIPSIPESALTIHGPWLVFSTETGLWAVNHDGSSLTQILRNENPDRMGTAYGIFPAPRGGRIAVVTVDNIMDLASPQLSLISMISVPRPEIEKIAALFPEAAEITAYTRADIDIWATVGVWNDLAWSSDGHKLAFNGAMDGSSSDLYVYDLDDKEITRLTSGPMQSVDPIWSPDDQSIVHAGIYATSWGASGIFGYSHYDAIWSARADASQVDRLFSSDVTGWENVLGWIDNHTYLADSAYNMPLCNLENIRVVDIQTGNIRPVWSDPYFARAFDPNSGIVLLSVIDDSTCGEENEPGLYQLSTDPAHETRLIVEGDVGEVDWSDDAQLFFVKIPTGVMAVDSYGRTRDLVSPDSAIDLPIVARGSGRLAWIGDGLWIGSLKDSLDQEPVRIFNQSVTEATWSPDGENILFFGGDGLFVAYGPDFTPLLIAEGLDNRNGFSGWVMP